MEFLDEETRPRFLFQSRSVPQSSNNPDPHSQSLHKPTIFISLFLSSLLFVLSFVFPLPEPLNYLLFWFALSLLLGPFAPSSLTGGDIRVGLGPNIPPPPSNSEEENNPIEPNKRLNRKSKARKIDELRVRFDSNPVSVNGSVEMGKREDNYGGKSFDVVVEEERDWSEGDVELLKKFMAKNPVGKPGRWEAIAEGFKGRHGVESVIKKAKTMGDKKMSDGDSFSRFLKDRKPVDKRMDAGNDEFDVDGGGGGVVENGEMKKESGGGGGNWSSGEDIALLNALKMFPKDVSRRWEKIAAALPGKSKAACMKRVTELKKDFRSSKTSAEA